ASALARSPYLAGVQTLDLRGNPLGDAGLLALAGGEWPNLSALDLTQTQVTARGLEALARAPFAPQLRALTLSLNGLGPDAVRALCSERLSGLQDLQLGGGNPIGPEGAALLGQAPLSGLLRLDLSYCRIGDEDLRGLLAGHGFPSLIILGLYHN